MALESLVPNCELKELELKEPLVLLGMPVLKTSVQTSEESLPVDPSPPSSWHFRNASCTLEAVWSCSLRPSPCRERLETDFLLDLG